ncbi:DNA adenine methylase [Streptomyces sp. NPDC001339]|uniref:DNA adenine methylase n=1 Tax=Streptomyces sp. NPDC001339 TaxID=3364563 RepID=UPI00367C2E17
MKPPVPYFGGKIQLAPWLVSLMPAHDHYVEPFAGSLAVMFAKPPSRMETVNDLDAELVTFWRVLRDRYDDFARAVTLTPHSRAEHIAAYGTASPGDDLERARRVWVRLTQGRSARLDKTGWRFQIKAGSSPMPVYLDGYRGRLAAAAARLAAVTLECRPALDVIEAYGANPDALLYVDPPYLDETRNGHGYRVEMPDEDAHRALAAALRRCRAPVMLSGYDSPLYAELYEGWHRYALATRTGNAAEGNGARTEVVWANRPLVAQAELFEVPA